MSTNEQLIQQLKTDSALTCEVCETVMTVEQERLRMSERLGRRQLGHQIAS